MPFLSKRQQRWANATDQPFAKRWDKLTDFGALPEKKDSATTGMAIPPTGDHALFNQPGIESRSNYRKRRKKLKAVCTCTTITTTKASTGQPGEKISPGVTRIRGNLCNVHGRYGPCDKGGSAKKPKKGRAPAKPKLTPAQRAQARDAEHATNRTATLTQQGYGADDQTALEALRGGAQPIKVSSDLIDQGVVEQATDGSYRLTSSGRALMNAAGQGDAGRARDTVSGARDRLSARNARRQAAAVRQQETATRRAQTTANREQAAKLRAERAAAKKPAKAGGGGSKKKPEAQAAPAKTPAKRRFARKPSTVSVPSGGSSASAAKKPAKPKPAPIEKPRKPRISPALHEAAQKLSDGDDVSDDQLQQLITNGLVKLNRDGQPILTAAGMRATMKAQSDQDKAMFANMGGGGSGGGGGKGGKPTGGTGGLWKKGPDGKRSPQAGAAQSGGGAKPQSDQDVSRAREDAQQKINDNAKATRDASNEHRDLIKRANAETDEAKQNKLYDQAQVTGARLDKLNAERESLNKKFDAAHNEGVNRSRARTDAEIDKQPKPAKDHLAHLPQDLSQTTAAQQRAYLEHHVNLSPAELKKRQLLNREQSLSAREQLKKTHPGDPAYDRLIRGQNNLMFDSHMILAAMDRQERDAKKKPKKKEYPSFTIIKSSDGTPDRWLAITTTAYEDKDREIISTKAIERAVALGDQTGERGPLLYWHITGLEMGDCDFQAQGGPGGRFLIEGGTFRSKAFAELGHKLSAAGYQMSPGFVHTDDQPHSGVYDNILIYERSAVPQHRASNYFTRYATKEDKVITPEKAQEYREKAAGNAEALALLDTLLATTAKEDATAQARNVVFKEAPDWAQALISRIDGLEATVKAFPPAAPVEGSPEEEAAEPDAEAMAEGDDMQDDGGGMDDAAFAQMIAQAVVQALSPLLDMEKKMAGHVNDMKSMVSGIGQQKDDATTATQQQIAQLEAKLKELTGDLPSSVMSGAANFYRPSQSPLTKLTPGAEAVVKEQISQVPTGLTDPNEIAAYQLIFGNS